MPTITNLQNRTHKILDKFIDDIANITLVNDFERSKLLRRTKLFFDAMNELSMEEFAKIFIDYNFSSKNVAANETFQASLHCLVGLVVEKYSQSDLLRYFFPENLSVKENRPEYSSNVSRISHWCKLIGYWLRQLRNQSKYDLTPENNHLVVSLNHIKESLGNKSYLSSNIDNDFKTHLGILVKEIEKKAIYPSMSDISRESLNAQEYHQALVEKGQELQAFESNLQERNIAANKLEITLSEERQNFKKQEEKLEHKAKLYGKQKSDLSTRENLFDEQIKFAAQREENYQERLALLTEERKEIEKKEKIFETEKKELNEKISKLAEKFQKEKSYIHHLENSNSNLEKSNSNLENDIMELILEEPNPALEEGLKELIKEFDNFPNQASKNFSDSSPSTSRLFKLPANHEGGQENQSVNLIKTL
jgi:DNA repair exonuclease SbcCD ATPase subunit